MDYIKDYNPWEKTFSLLNKSMMYQQTIVINYYSYSSRKLSEREINPYHIFSVMGGHGILSLTVSSGRSYVLFVWIGSMEPS